MAEKGKMIRRACAVLALFSALLSPAAAAALEDGIPSSPADREQEELTVLADGALYPGEVRLSHGVSWVPLRDFALFAEKDASIEWDGERNEAAVRTDSLSLTVTVGDTVLEANGRLLLCPGAPRIEEDRLWVPLRTVSRAFGFSCTYDPEGPAAILAREEEAVPFRGAEEEDRVYWLSRIIEAEAGAEPFDGKLAVGSVILNRVLSDEFPDTVWGVIFDDRHGVQFTPTENGAIWGEPGEDSVRAACLTLDNPHIWDDIEYFLNPAIADSLWIPAAREYAFTIGGHAFYR